jgi:serine/threonine protein kinase
MAMPSPTSDDHQREPEAPGKDAHLSDDTLTQEDATRTVDRDGAETVAVIPDSVGDVDIVKLLGRGGMGAVYLGRDRMLSRDVAVKFLLHIVAGEGDPRFEEFLHGARKAAKLRHPNLVTMYHAALTDVGPYLVMEHIDGPTLREILHEHGPLPQRVALRIMKDVATAVSALHEHDVIHRDIKPGNILFDREGHLFVTDFGLACHRPRGTGIGDRQHKVAGSPAYMGPEMFRGEVSTRTDVYAMGVMLYELLTGMVPFTGEFEELRKRHQENAPDVQPLQQRDVPAELIDVIERAMHKRELFRFKTAREFVRALDQCGVSAASDAELGQYVLIGCKGDSPCQDPMGESAAGDSSSYFDRLAQIASAKQASRSDAGIPPFESSKQKEDEVIVEIELACIECGYTLTGAAIRDECPECSRPVMRSLERRLLENADFAWLEKVAKGLREVHTSLWLALGVLIAGSIMFLVAENLARFDTIAALRRAEPFLAAGAYGLVLAFGARGAFCVTAVEPQFPLAEGTLFLNRAVRCAAGGATIAFAAHMFPLLTFQETLRSATGLITGLLLIFAASLVLLYMRHLALRMPEPELARGLHASATLILFTGVLAVAAVRLRSTQVDPSLGPIAKSLAGLMLLLVGGAAWWAIVLLTNLRHRTDAIIKSARRRENRE